MSDSSGNLENSITLPRRFRIKCEDFEHVISELIGPRYSGLDLMFRGQGSGSWSVTSSMQRACEHSHAIQPVSSYAYHSQFQQALMSLRDGWHPGIEAIVAEFESAKNGLNFETHIRAMAIDLIKKFVKLEESKKDDFDFNIDLSSYDRLCSILQHHGFPTMSIDFTRSAMHAAWFAIRQAVESGEESPCILVFDYHSFDWARKVWIRHEIENNLELQRMISEYPDSQECAMAVAYAPSVLSVVDLICLHKLSTRSLDNQRRRLQFGELLFVPDSIVLDDICHKLYHFVRKRYSATGYKGFFIHQYSMSDCVLSQAVESLRAGGITGSQIYPEPVGTIEQSKLELELGIIAKGELLNKETLLTRFPSIYWDLPRPDNVEGE